MTNHFILHIGDGINFTNSSDRSIWAVSSRFKKSFLDKVQPGDKLWFIRKREVADSAYGRIYGVADFVSKVNRETGPLIELTPSNSVLGWDDDKGGVCDIQIIYTEFYYLYDCPDLYTGIRNQTSVRGYENNKDTIPLDLPFEYKKLVQYEKCKKK